MLGRTTVKTVLNVLEVSAGSCFFDVDTGYYRNACAGKSNFIRKKNYIDF